MRVSSLYVIGAGGTGGWVIPPLARLSAMGDGVSDGFPVTIVDGDAYDAGNVMRQAFANGDTRPKVDAVADAVRAMVPGVDIRPVPEYWTGREIAGAVLDAPPGGVPVVVFAVDNTATVADGWRALSALDPARDWLAVICGNEYDSAMVTVGGRIGGADVGATPLLFENFRNPTDRIPGGGCSVDTTPSAPQLLAANFASANWGVWAVSAIVHGWPVPALASANLAGGAALVPTHMAGV